MTALPRPCVYLVTDRRQLAPSARTVRDEVTALEAFLDDAVDAGVDAIQIRERDLDVRRLERLVRRVHARAHPAGTHVLVNDRADVAAAAGADGVHLREDGMPPSRVRARIEAWTIGRSVHAAGAGTAHEGADYLLFGTVFASASKPASWHVAGLDQLAAMAASTTLPVLAIGGVTPAHVRAVVAAGAAGVAAIGVFLPPPLGLGPGSAVRALRDALGAAEARP